MTNTAWKQEGAGGPPVDLRNWAPELEVVTWVLEAVEAIDWSFPPLARATREAGEGRPKTLATLLTYCYATNCYESRAIAEMVYTDATVRYLTANAFPEPRLLRRFRRQHRDILRQCLIQVFQKACRNKWGSTYRPLPPALVRNLYFTAEERINRAVFFDGMTLDD